MLSYMKIVEAIMISTNVYHIRSFEVISEFLYKLAQECDCLNNGQSMTFEGLYEIDNVFLFHGFDLVKLYYQICI